MREKREMPDYMKPENFQHNKEDDLRHTEENNQQFSFIYISPFIHSVFI